ncbi:MFS general substrate transporter [Marasmius fiardii PR-910]|nr:MFS general substrate transporter [Marasmius fiardii PR-910]
MENSKPEEDTVPDGGLRAWLVVVGVTCLAFTAFGCTSTWGVFQAYYEETYLKGSSPSKIAWIGSIQNAMVFIPSMIMGRIFDKGYYHTMLISATVVVVVATMLVAECRAYWQFLLCQGFVVGLACGALTNPSPAVVAQWFKKRRALALGITACGSSIGGTIFPIAIRGLIPLIGFQWTMRVLGFMFLTVLTVAILTVRRRIPPSHSSSPLLGLKPLKTPAFAMWCVGTLFMYFGLYSFLSYVASTAVSNGFSRDFSFTLVAIVNGCSGIGRVSAGIVANYIGPVNHMIPATTITTAVVLAWPAATTQASLLTITVLYGLSAGSIGALLWSPILDLGEREEVSQRVGILMLSLACAGLVGPPMTGEVSSAAGMTAMGAFAGGCMLVGVSFACVARYMLIRKMWGKI